MLTRIYFLALPLFAFATAHAQKADDGKAAFRAIYQEMVEIDSSPTTGSCTKVVRAAETRLQAAGFSGGDVQVVIPDGKPVGAPAPSSPGEWDRHWATPSGVLTTPKISPKKPTPIADPDDVPPIPDR